MIKAPSDKSRLSISVGHVGALAAFLGIGAAVAVATGGVACADPPGNDSTTARAPMRASAHPAARHHSPGRAEQKRGAALLTASPETQQPSQPGGSSAPVAAAEAVQRAPAAAIDTAWNVLSTVLSAALSLRDAARMDTMHPLCSAWTPWTIG